MTEGLRSLAAAIGRQRSRRGRGSGAAGYGHHHDIGLVKPPITEGMGFQPFRPLSEALAGQACYNIPGLATVLSCFSSDAL